jgi:hypothetical protein
MAHLPTRSMGTYFGHVLCVWNVRASHLFGILIALLLVVAVALIPVWMSIDTQLHTRKPSGKRPTLTTVVAARSATRTNVERFQV